MSDARQRRKKKPLNVFASVSIDLVCNKILKNNQTEGITLHHARLLNRADTVFTFFRWQLSLLLPLSHAQH